MRLWTLSLLLGLTSCGSFQRWSIRSASPMFKESSHKLTREGHWEFFKASAPGNLKFLELFAQHDPSNIVLQGVLAKGYAGYAFAVHETLAFGDELDEKENSESKKDAIFFYTRAMDYGLDYLTHKGLTRKDLLSLEDQELKNKFNSKLDKDDHSAVLYTAQAWASLINLQKDNIALVSQIPKVKNLFDWVCGENPSIDSGVCDIFKAQYEATRPRMLGGSPEKAEILYKEAIIKYPHHLLIRVALIQTVYMPAFEKEKYEAEAKVLKEEFIKWENLNRDNLENTSEYKNDQDLNLFNAIAKKRFEMIEKNKTKIFGE